MMDWTLALTQAEWDARVRSIRADHIAAGGCCGQCEAEEIVAQVYGPRPTDEAERSGAISTK